MLHPQMQVILSVISEAVSENALIGDKIRTAANNNTAEYFLHTLFTIVFPPL